MMQRGTVGRGLAALAVLVGVTLAIAGASGSELVTLPNGWLIAPPRGQTTGTDTMPQGAAISPDGRTLAVVAAGYNPPTLRLYRLPDLEQTASVPLEGAFGRPLWTDRDHILVAGANADALLQVDVSDQTVRKLPMPAGSYPVAIARWGDTMAVATDGDSSVRIGALGALQGAPAVRIGGHIGGMAFSTSGTLYVSNSSGSHLVAINSQSLATRSFPTGLHPTAILPTANAIYVAESDGDTVGVYDPSTAQRLASIYVGDLPVQMHLDGVSPNAIAQQGDRIFVSLGAANDIAVIVHRKVVGRIAAGWYPTDVVPSDRYLYIIDGKGERSPPNPNFKPQRRGYYDYIATLQYGSIRAYGLGARSTLAGNPQGAVGWSAQHSDPVVRTGGPISHVFFILKENRSYDQILGDMPEGNGDPKLTWFGADVTPNEHALAKQFGLFDNTYASGEVSETGHFWADMAFANDYVERTWPSVYAGRNNTDDRLSNIGTPFPKNGYIWQAAAAAHITFRNYGEMSAVPPSSGPASKMSDPHYVGWNLDYSDVDRFKEWQREFRAFIRQRDVPQLEYIWLPNDHTYGSRAGKFTPVALVAQNDYAVGLIVDAISHSPIWSSSVIFITEDDAQDGPDHVSDQRTTCFVVSPYSRGGLEHDHFSTVSIVRTMELLIGLKPLSNYDAMAVPMYRAFSATPVMGPFQAISPKVSITTRNSAKAYGSKVSSQLNFTRPDANTGATLIDILGHNHKGGY